MGIDGSGGGGVAGLEAIDGAAVRGVTVVKGCMVGAEMGAGIDDVGT